MDIYQYLTVATSIHKKTEMTLGSLIILKYIIQQQVHQHLSLLSEYGLAYQFPIL